MSVVSNRMKRSQRCPEKVYETWRADEVIWEQARRNESCHSRDCHDLSHTYARVKMRSHVRNTTKTDKTEKKCVR